MKSGRTYRGACFSLNYGFLRVYAHNGIAGSYGSSIFSFLRNFHTVLIVAVSIYIPTNSARGFPFLHILSSIYRLYIFFLISILTGVRRYLVVLICISLMLSNVEHPFMCLLAMCISSLGKCLFSSSAHFWIGFFFDTELHELLVNFGD